MSSTPVQPQAQRKLAGLVTGMMLAFSLVAGSLFNQAAHAQDSSKKELPQYIIDQFGEPPAIPEGPLSPELEQAVKTAFIDSLEHSAWERDQELALQTITESGDVRLVWLISDLMRFVSQSSLIVPLVESTTEMLGIDFEDGNYWGKTTDHLMAWDIPAPPNYLEGKRKIFTTPVSYTHLTLPTKRIV